MVSSKWNRVATDPSLWQNKIITITDTTFRTNEAPKGAALSIAAATSVRITTTTIDKPEDESSSAVWTKAASGATCAENPCEPGSQCTFEDSSTFCEPCGDNEFGAGGISCDACQPGTQPSGAPNANVSLGFTSEHIPPDF